MMGQETAENNFSDDGGYVSNIELASKLKKEENGENTTATGVTKRCRIVGENLIVVLTIIGVFLGIGLGMGIREAKPSTDAITLINFPGEMLMRMLKMLIIPVIITSIVSGLADLDLKKSGRMGAHALLYYLFTTTVAVFLGILLVSVIQPGSSTKPKEGMNEEQEIVSTFDTFLDLIRNVFPDNIIAATFELIQTKTTAESSSETSNLTNTTDNVTSNIKYSKSVVLVHNPNVLGIIAFFIAFGIILSSLGEEGRSVADFFNTLNKIFMKMIGVVIWYSPIGICSLIAGNILKMEKVEDIFEELGMYMVTVIAGILIHFSIILPLLFFIVTRKNPYKYMFGLSQALLTALGTSSSAGTLPITMRCLENNLQIDKRVTKFTLPLGATMNMDGTALLEGVAAITIAQMYNVSLSAAQIFTISITATLASVGAAAIPSAGLVTLILVLTAIGLPTEPVGLLWSIDWFLDRLRTATNVLGDAYGAGIVQHLNRKQLNDNTPCDEPIQNSDHDRGEVDHLLSSV